MIGITLADERPRDAKIIHQLISDAFATTTFSDGREPYVVRALRDRGELITAVTARSVNRIVGHAVTSPVTIQNVENWYGLGPISVAPDLFKSGIGSALVDDALARLKVLDAHGCALIGNPVYYSRFGFQSREGFTHAGLPTPVVQFITFKGDDPTGELVFSKAFEVIG